MLLTTTSSDGAASAGDPLPIARENALAALLARSDAPLVSVIVRSMDRPEFHEALASIERQIYPNIEVVVVNAKGPEHRVLPDRCGRFPLRGVGVGEALGRSRAANVGLAEARGDYLIFLDDDDWFLANHVAALVAALERHPEAEVAYTGARALGLEGHARHVFNEPFNTALLRSGNFIPLHTALFRRAVVSRGVCFDEDLEVYEDWDFWLQVARRGEFIHLDQISACYRVGGASRVGLTPDNEQRRAGRGRVFEKWRLLWTGQEMNAMVEECRGREPLLLDRLTDKEKELHKVARRVSVLEASLIRAHQSWSFQVTRPLRWLGSRLRKPNAALVPSGDAGAEGGVSATARPAARNLSMNQPEAPLISVVVPVYNACRTNPSFLRDALMSVCGQTYRNLEIIIVDDGSTDATRTICADVIDTQTAVPIYYLSKKNGGQSSARNLGIAQSRGEFVSFLDQDDMWYADKLEHVLELLRPGIDTVYTDADTIDENSQILLTGIHRNHRCGWPHPKRTVEDILFRDVFVMPGLLTARRDLLARIGGFDETLSGYEDDDLFLRLFLNGSVAYSPKSTLKWRMHQENYSQSSRMVRSRLRYWEKLMAEQAGGGTDRRRAKGISRRFFREFLRQATSQLRDHNPMYEENLATAKRIVPYLPLFEKLVLGYWRKAWCRLGAASETVSDLLKGWSRASESADR